MTMVMVSVSSGYERGGRRDGIVRSVFKAAEGRLTGVTKVVQ